MSAYEVTDKLVPAIESGKYDMIILNYANLIWLVIQEYSRQL